MLVHLEGGRLESERERGLFVIDLFDHFCICCMMHLCHLRFCYCVWTRFLSYLIYSRFLQTKERKKKETIHDPLKLVSWGSINCQKEKDASTYRNKKNKTTSACYSAKASGKKHKALSTFHQFCVWFYYKYFFLVQYKYLFCLSILHCTATINTEHLTEVLKCFATFPTN